MNSMTSAGPMANSAFVMTPQNGYPVIPGGMVQVPLYPSNQPQVHLIPRNPPGLEPSVSVQPTQRALKEGKALGAVQILIGLIHFGLGSITGTVLSGCYIAISFYGGFPFWGGIWFIISGSLSVSAENYPKSSCLLNGSLGLNIVSAICSVVGIILFITDLSLASTSAYSERYYCHAWGVTPGMAISAVLLIFCLLELCIACTSSHFGCQLVCCQQNNVGVVYPKVYVPNPVVIAEPANPPSTYSN
ncbi:membrane-spanning 4-domains subfamily A member 8-like [Diceros bicornis minor]|uniref:membrane-spanning 4-domains subfamily A member 8-like n=1 Tax=Diceros bicornis minor TaxID=77932 RepID=UPI0026F07D6C|nr:membrane-spanning 4-domains subfamily A member 8-like [Diceros bicornis minor]